MDMSEENIDGEFRQVDRASGYNTDHLQDREMAVNVGTMS
jgi:hypothetical protein